MLARPGEPTPPRRAALVYIFHSGNLYGMERMALATMCALPEYERRIVLAPHSDGAAGSALAAAQVAKLEALEYSDRSSLVRRLREVMAEARQVDIVTSSITQSVLVAASALAMRTRVRHLHAVHGSGRPHQYRWKPILVPLPLRYVAVSSYVRDQLVASHVPAGRIVVAENFLDSPSVGYPSRGPYTERPAGGSAPVRVVAVGRADQIKRLDLLVAVASKIPELVIDVFGAGPELEALREAAHACPNLAFRGFDPDVAARIAEADFLVHTCPVEAFGLIVLEAYQAGVVPIVPDEGGTATLVDDGRSGLLYRAGDASDLVRALRVAAGMSPEQLDAMAQTGRALLETRFSADQGARSYRRAFGVLGP